MNDEVETAPPDDLIFRILDRCPVGIAVIGYDGRIVMLNPAFCGIFGYDRHAMLDRVFTMVYPPEERQAAMERHQRFLDGSGPLTGEYDLVRQDGSRITALSESVFMPDNAGRPCRLVYVLDITSRRKVEEEMQIAATVYQTSREAMIVTDADNHIIAINPAFTALTGYSLPEVHGKNPRIFKSDRHDTPFYQDMWEALTADGHWTGEVWDRRKNGDTYLKELTINVVKDSDGRVFRFVGMFSDITARKRTEEIVWHQANFDALTGLPNRHMFGDRLQQAARKAHREHQPVALMLIDLDRFKEVNDSLGHNAGDRLLIEAASRILSCVRGTDTVARLGGDEFAVILPQLEDANGIDRVAQALLRRLAEPIILDSETVFISASIGISLYPSDTEALDVLFKNADQAMYVAKSEGRNRFSYFTPALQEAALNRLRLTTDLRTALAEEQFCLYYQPIVELASGAIHKAEALVRWLHPTRGLVSPAEFIPVAEETGLIVPLGDWIFRQAVAQVATWRNTLDPSFQVSINKSPVQFLNHDAADSFWFQEMLDQHINGQAVVIEITEGLLLNVDARVQDKLLQFREEGIQIAIDDFGTGYSSLAYLQKFDIDYLKIDQSFVRNLETAANVVDLCEAIIVMAHRLGLKVIAEGVETAGQRDILAAVGCDYAQGYLFSRPVPAAEFEKLLKR